MESLQGVAASEGIGIGRAMLVEEPDLSFDSRAIEDTAAEMQRFHGAIESFKELTAQQVEAVRRSAGESEAEILQGHISMISDPYMVGEMDKLIEGGQCAEEALSQVCDMFAGMFRGADDEFTRQRATDVDDTKRGVLCQLLNKRDVDVSMLPQDTIIVTHELTPSMTAGIDAAKIQAVITETGGVTSHSAILARALELPAVLSVPDACRTLSDNMPVVADGSAGTVIAMPDAAALSDARARRERFLTQREELKRFVGCKTVTADGAQVELFANIGTPDDATRAVEADAEGVGLFRTEFLFMDADTMPTEDQQFDAYKKAALIMKGEPVIIRTLDIGGDKDIPCLGMEREDNPFMGFRAIRYCLQREDVYRTQLRALLRASAFGDVRIMIPLVTCIDEVRAVRDLIKRYMAEFDREGVSYNADIPVGVMIETPAAVAIADVLAREADFFSIGTNDLTGYTMCADRGNDRVRYLYSTCNPAVLRGIRRTIEQGSAAGISVGMCGEAAADPLLIPLWVAWGLDEYSVSASSVLGCRAQIASWHVEDARALAEEVMQMQTATEVYERLKAAVEGRE